MILMMTPAADRSTGKANLPGSCMAMPLSHDSTAKLRSQVLISLRTKEEKIQFAVEALRPGPPVVGIGCLSNMIRQFADN